jgi:AraC-like DNA-binding protein
MSIYYLPQEFSSFNQLPVVFQYSYTSQRAVERSQVALSHHLISFLQLGKKTVILPQKVVEIPDQHFLLLSEGQCLMTEKLSIGGRYHNHLLFFEHSVVEQLLLRHVIVVQRKAHSANFRVLPYDAFIHNFVSSLKWIPNTAGWLLQHKVEEFLLYGYYQYGAAFFSFLKKPPLPALQRLVQVAQQAIYEQLTIEQMAFLCAMSVSTFKRRFAEHYQNTPQAWLREQRLQEAARQLRQGPQQLSDLAAQLGFQHRSSFSAAFKARFGVTPSAYANAQRINRLIF